MNFDQHGFDSFHEVFAWFDSWEKFENRLNTDKDTVENIAAFCFTLNLFRQPEKFTLLYVQFCVTSLLVCFLFSSQKTLDIDRRTSRANDFKTPCHNSSSSMSWSFPLSLIFIIARCNFDSLQAISNCDLCCHYLFIIDIVHGVHSTNERNKGIDEHI
jgi:hypothetical protein